MMEVIVEVLKPLFSWSWKLRVTGVRDETFQRIISSGLFQTFCPNVAIVRSGPDCRSTQKMSKLLGTTPVLSIKLSLPQYCHKAIGFS